MSTQDIRVPDLGNFADVPVIDVLVKVGESVEAEAPLITLETDKASMDVPTPTAGTIVEVCVGRGERVSKGSLIARISVASVSTVATAASAAAEAPQAEPSPTVGRAAAPVALPIASDPPPSADQHAPVLVLGAGPGGYTAAFRAADLGLAVTLVERGPTLGGVCLNVGCIPSKALLHAAKVIDEAHAMAEHGIVFGAPQIDVPKLRAWKSSVVGKLTGGLSSLARQRKVTVLNGEGRFVGPRLLEVKSAEGVRTVSFDHCIIAAGSLPVRLPGLPDDPRIMDSTAALELADVPARMLVIGGGIIGLEMGCVYEALGSKVSVVELMRQLMPGADPDLVKPLEKRLRKRYEQVMLGVKVKAVVAEAAGIRVSFEGEGAPEPQLYDRVLVAVGRKPNGALLEAGKAGVNVDERGFIAVDKQMRTNVPHIFAIGDLVGQPMLAHKASHEGKVAAEVIAGEKRAFDARVIPSVAYTDPEVAWVGLTETEAKAKGIAVQKGLFPWAASGRSLAQGRDEGFTKLLFDPQSHRVLGGGIVGPNAGELIGEIALAIEMGADAADVGLTIHPHPTLSESIAFSAEAFEGTLTDLYVPKKK
ncbi:MAG: dihydrolipoyl dehydrogenase [Sinobacteraceae bacterium]|nr:dihydrolipoyl dehydrogenase [Nevskiaceae bacterium]